MSYVSIFLISLLSLSFLYVQSDTDTDTDNLKADIRNSRVKECICTNDLESIRLLALDSLEDKKLREEIKGDIPEWRSLSESRCKLDESALENSHLFNGKKLSNGLLAFEFPLIYVFYNMLYKKDLEKFVNHNHHNPGASWVPRFGPIQLNIKLSTLMKCASNFKSFALFSALPYGVWNLYKGFTHRIDLADQAVKSETIKEHLDHLDTAIQ